MGERATCVTIAVCLFAAMGTARADEPARPALTEAECKTEAAAVDKLLTTMEIPTLAYGGLGFTPAIRTKQREALVYKPSRIIEITADGALRLDDEPVADAAALGTALAATLAELQATAAAVRRKPDPPLATFAIDGRATWATIVPVVDAVRAAGVTAVRFVVAYPAKVKPPARVALDDDFDALGALPTAAARSDALAALVHRVSDPCPALADVWKATADANPADRMTTLLTGVGGALRACSCAADPAAVRALFFRMHGTGFPQALITATLSPKGTKVAHPGDRPWSQIAPSVPAKKRLRFVVK